PGRLPPPPSTDPAPRAPHTSGPNHVSVTFDRPLGPGQNGTLDVWIQRRGADGSWANLFASFSAPPEALDATGTVLTLTLPQALTPGDYRIVLPEFSPLTGADGSSLADLG